MVICRISRAEPLSVLATQSWGQAGVLVHMETAVSRLHQSLSLFEVGFVTRWGLSGSCVRPRHSSSNRVFYSLCGLETNLPIAIFVYVYAECQSADCRFTVFGIIALRYDNLGYGRLVDCYSAAVIIVVWRSIRAGRCWHLPLTHLITV